MVFDTVLTVVLVALLFLSFHSYVLYPLIMRVIASFQKEVKGAKSIPTVSILISAYNEEKVIRARVANIAAQNYELKKIELLIGSDNSKDDTNRILAELEKEYSWLKIFLFPQRRGKASVLNDLIAVAQNEIVVFTDANTQFDVNALPILLERFGEEQIGGVCGRLVLRETSETKLAGIEEKKYWQYETSIKKSEGKCGVLIGANGGIFAVRRELLDALPADSITDDLYISLSVLMKGRKFVYQDRAVATEDITSDLATEFKRKVRFAATNFRTVLYCTSLLVDRNILLAFAFWSHKILRWVFPLILILMFITNLLLLDASTLFIVLFRAQLILYGIGVAGYVLSAFKIRITVFSVVYFFMISNIALLVGFLKFIRGKGSPIWQSTPR